MAWCTHLLPKLAAGETVKCRPRGNSMTPKIFSGNLCTISPYKSTDVLSKGDIVLCKVHGAYYLHLVTAVRADQVQISNNHGHVNGWTTVSNVFGKLEKVEP